MTTSLRILWCVLMRITFVWCISLELPLIVYVQPVHKSSAGSSVFATFSSPDGDDANAVEVVDDR